MLISEQQETIMVFKGAIEPAKRAYLAFLTSGEEIAMQQIVESAMFRNSCIIELEKLNVHKRNTLVDIQVNWVFGKNDS